jgi:hypothetical protein
VSRQARRRAERIEEQRMAASSGDLTDVIQALRDT